MACLPTLHRHRQATALATTLASAASPPSRMSTLTAPSLTPSTPLLAIPRGTSPAHRRPLHSRMHVSAAPAQWISPYAAMQIPTFSRADSLHVSDTAQREYASWCTINTAGNIVARKEKDKASLQDAKKAAGQTIDLAET